MRIIFNLMNCGLGNNGGSRTLIKSANTLQDLGHEVTIIDTGRNQNTWIPLKAKHIKIKKNSNLPNADAVIGTGYNTWKSTLNLPRRCGKKFAWVRGWETWNAPQEKLLNALYDKRLSILVNSICLQQKLKYYNLYSCIVRPGNDFDEIFPNNTKTLKDGLIIGGLFNSGSKRKTKQTEWIFEAVKRCKEKFAGLKLWMFGTDGYPNNPVVDEYWKDPSIEDKNAIYNRCHIWLFPSILEGLSIVCQEALLAECCLIATNAEMSGTQDFLINNSTGLVSDTNINSFTDELQRAIIYQDLREKYGKNGRDLVVKLGDRESNMKQLVSVLERP